jgi:PHP family Zn ribbon phosphoesterase
MAIEEQPHNSSYDRFVKVDFHIHTPESKCYSDPMTTPEQIVDTALAAELDAITITDHNTFRGVDAVRKVGLEKGLVVFPGIELSTEDGHFLALFNHETPVSQLEDFLDYIGGSAAGSGDGTIPVRDETRDILRKINERVGIAIAAHIERWPTGFLQTTKSRRVKMRIHSSEYLTALEITQPQNRGLWNRGQVRDYPKKHACIQGSDAHALDEIGRRPTYMKIPSLNLKGIRLAFNEYESRIRFPEEIEGNS